MSVMGAGENGICGVVAGSANAAIQEALGGGTSGPMEQGTWFLGANQGIRKAILIPN